MDRVFYSIREMVADWNKIKMIAGEGGYLL